MHVAMRQANTLSVAHCLSQRRGDCGVMSEAQSTPSAPQFHGWVMSALLAG